MNHNSFAVRAWGPTALFTDPHFRADPKTYPFPTPSAMKGLLRSIFVKPEFEWEADKVYIHRPVRYDTFKIRASNTSRYNPDAPPALRTFTVLCDVEYTVVGRIAVNPLRSSRPAASYGEEIRKRMRRGEEFRTPHFGMRSHPAHWEFIEDEADIPATEPINLDFGPMLFDLRPVDIRTRYDKQGRITKDPDHWLPIFFPAEIKNGVLEVPRKFYDRERDHLMKFRNDISKPSRPSSASRRK